MPAVPTDPFTTVWRSIWDYAVGWDGLQQYIKKGNFVSFADNIKFPLKQVVQDGDLPELILIPAGFASNLHNTSSSQMITRNYQWAISTGDLRIWNTMPIQFELLRAMTAWKLQLNGNNITWRDKSFVKRMNITAATEGQSDAERNRGIKGWSALVNLEVEMHFSISDMKDGL